jgi:hypothetical protein
MAKYADADVAAIDKKKAAKEQELTRARREEIESTRAAEIKEKSRPSKPRKVPTADELRGGVPKLKEPEPAPLATPAVPPGESEAFKALAAAAQACEEAAIRAEWQSRNDSTLGVESRQVYRHKAVGLREAAQIVREIDIGYTEDN